MNTAGILCCCSQGQRIPVLLPGGKTAATCNFRNFPRLFLYSKGSQHFVPVLSSSNLLNLSGCTEWRLYREASMFYEYIRFQGSVHKLFFSVSTAQRDLGICGCYVLESPVDTESMDTKVWFEIPVRETFSCLGQAQQLQLVNWWKYKLINVGKSGPGMGRVHVTILIQPSPPHCHSGPAPYPCARLTCSDECCSVCWCQKEGRLWPFHQCSLNVCCGMVNLQHFFDYVSRLGLVTRLIVSNTVQCIKMFG